MSKYRRREKRLQAVKMLMVFAAIQILWIGFGCVILHSARIATEANTEQITVILDRVEIVHGISIGRHKQTSSHTYLYADDVRYECSGIVYREYDLADITDLKGKTLHIMTMADDRIVELSCGDTVYYTVEDFNKRQALQMVSGVLLWSVFEFVFVCVSILCWFVYGNGQYKKKKARRQTGRGM